MMSFPASDLLEHKYLTEKGKEIEIEIEIEGCSVLLVCSRATFRSTEVQ